MVVASAVQEDGLVVANGKCYRRFSFRTATEAIRAWEEMVAPKPAPVPERIGRPKERMWRRRSERPVVNIE